MKKYLLGLLGTCAFIFANASSALEIAAIKEGTVQILFNQAVTQSTTYTLPDACAFFTAGYTELRFKLWTVGPGNDAPNIKVNILNYSDPTDGFFIKSDPSTFNLNNSTPFFSKMTRIPPDSCIGVPITIHLDVDGSEK